MQAFINSDCKETHSVFKATSRSRISVKLLSMNKSILFTIFIFFISGCSGSPPKAETDMKFSHADQFLSDSLIDLPTLDNDSLTTIKLPEVIDDPYNTFQISDWVESVRYVSLETSKESLISGIEKSVIDYVLKRNFSSKTIWLEKIPFFLLALFFGILTMLSHGPLSVSLSPTEGYPYYQRIVFASYSLIEYFTKCLIPIKLSYIYPFPNLVGEALPMRFHIYPIALILIVITLWRFLKQKWIFFGIAFFVIHLAVALHIISISRFAIVADRYVYLSAVGVFFILAYGINGLITKHKKYRVYTFSGCLLYIISIGFYAHHRVKVWHDVVSLKKELREQLKNRKEFLDVQ